MPNVSVSLLANGTFPEIGFAFVTHAPVNPNSPVVVFIYENGNSPSIFIYCNAGVVIDPIAESLILSDGNAYLRAVLFAPNVVNGMTDFSIQTTSANYWNFYEVQILNSAIFEPVIAETDASFSNPESPSFTSTSVAGIPSILLLSDGIS
ncbi:MAG: hypothetical protein WCQ11_07015, partial [Actinomycetes bacterium]